ncbi:MAG: phosphoglucosamine mutase, partial [Pseudomonadota bacterium]|nr:phosphoglucosamine mutase [Pseudomonadota bacterium]
YPLAGNTYSTQEVMASLHGMLERAGAAGHTTRLGVSLLSWSFALGGEQSGHIVMTDYATTGDGLIAGLQFMKAMVETGKKASELAQVFTPVPQILRNVRYAAGKTPLEADQVQQAIADGEKQLNGDGRLLIRKSGTEPLIRVMGEANDQGKLDAVITQICKAVESAAS